MNRTSAACRSLTKTSRLALEPVIPKNRLPGWMLAMLFAMIGVAPCACRADDPVRLADAPRAGAVAPSSQWLVVLIGGIDSDPTPAQIRGTAARDEGNSGMFRLMGDLRSSGVAAEYFNWNGTSAGQIASEKVPGSAGIAGRIRGLVDERGSRRLALVGNSWGGHTALEVSQELFRLEHPLAVETAVFLDGSSAGRLMGPRRELASNVAEAFNLHTRHFLVWGAWKGDGRITNIDLGDPRHGFQKKGMLYDSPFDFKGHLQAEWDEAIHRAIQTRLRAVFPPAP